jgi:hypothetical protein
MIEHLENSNKCEDKIMIENGKRECVCVSALGACEKG